MNDGGEPNQEGPRIWVIDSRPEVLERVRDTLDGAGGSCELFDDARRVALVARQELPDLVILGLAKNRIPADELLLRGKEFPALRTIPVIVLYSDQDVVEVERVLEAGATELIALERVEEELVRRIGWKLSRAKRVKRKEGGEERFPSTLRMYDFLTRVIEASPNAIVAAERSGRIVLFNPAAEEILGWSLEEARQLHVRRLYPPGGAERIMKWIRSEEYGEPGHVESLREVVISSSGEMIPVEISAALVLDEEEEIATVGIFTDLRQQVQMEERLQQAIEVLEQTQRQAVVVEVAGAAAHELNQPLTSLLGYAELLRRQLGDDQDLRRAVETISNDARKIAEIVRKIGRITRYRTREYPGGEHIVDLDAASADISSELIATLEIERHSGSGTSEGD